MFHRLVVGHFDLCSGKPFVSRRPIDDSRAAEFMIRAGAIRRDTTTWELDGETIEFRDGFVSFPWISLGTNHAAASLAQDVAQDQHAILADESIVGTEFPSSGIFFPPELANEAMG